MTINPSEIPKMPDGYIMTEEDYRKSASNILALLTMFLEIKAATTMEYDDCKKLILIADKACARGCELIEPQLGIKECHEIYNNFVKHAKESLEERKTEE